MTLRSVWPGTTVLKQGIGSLCHGASFFLLFNLKDHPTQVKSPCTRRKGNWCVTIGGMVKNHHCSILSFTYFDFKNQNQFTTRTLRMYLNLKAFVVNGNFSTWGATYKKKSFPYQSKVFHFYHPNCILYNIQADLRKEKVKWTPNRFKTVINRFQVILIFKLLRK